MYNFFRMQMDTVENPDGSYSRDTLQICYKKPIVDDNGEPKSPYVELGILDINLSEYPDLKALVESATALAVPIAIDKLNNPPVMPGPQVEPTP